MTGLSRTSSSRCGLYRYEATISDKHRGPLDSFCAGRERGTLSG